MEDVAVVRSPEFLKHAPPGMHPECPERLLGIHKWFEPGAPYAGLPVLGIREAGESDLGGVHALEMIKRLAGARGRSGFFDADTYFNPASVGTALYAAGSTIDLALAIWKGAYRRGFSLVRPPGHHATDSRIMGFCLLNNVALAAAAILTDSPKARLAIVDFDLHHGNGTQDIFYDNPSVFFVSSHRFPFYPGTGTASERGRGKGLGATVNFPLATPYDGDFFLRLYGGIALPLVDRFTPDMILVSAGFDGHEKDPMEGFRISTKAYGTLAEQLIACAEKRGGKILFCLEGGYHPGALADSVGEVLAKLVSCPRRPFTPAPPPGESEGSADLDRLERIFRAN
jgi:acetoin utilization deacetylase AcuC-like enzyme